MSLKDRFPQLWQEWVDAGGPEAHFLIHLLRIGAEAPTAEGLLKNAEISADYAQGLKELIARLPGDLPLG
jgi:hypothetical protein